jgi:methylated-DNA-[protein]-cysteine S-methyltransferase
MVNSSRPEGYAALLSTPIGTLGIRTSGDCLTGIDLLPFLGSDIPVQTPLVSLVIGQLVQYFADPRAEFGIPVLLKGTPFQKQVWQSLRGIPPGQVLQYGALARKLGTSPRAVGNACRANPIPILIPCHRVVAADGLGGFMGTKSANWLSVKRWLLQHEGWEGSVRPRR